MGTCAAAAFALAGGGIVRTMLRIMATKRRRRQGSGDESVRKLTKTGSYTYYVTIPKADIEALGWRERQRLRVRRTGQKIVVEDWKAKK